MIASHLVAATKPWNIAQYDKFVAGAQREWHLVDRHHAPTRELIERIKPRYVFFPHWSWKVPAEIFNIAECALFHMTDLPFGRGGSRALEAYAQELRPFPHPRSQEALEALARWRCAESGLKAAEAFVTIREWIP